MIEAWECCAEWNKPVTRRQILYDSTYVSCFQCSKSRVRTECIMVVARAWVEGYCLMGKDRVLMLWDKRVIGTEGGAGICLIPHNWTLKMGKTVHFMWILKQ